MYPIKLVDTFELLDLCLGDIASPSVLKLAIDLEGVDLSRVGTISLLQIFSDLSNSVWVIDIFTLGSAAFNHIDPHGQSLKAVLENRATVKVWENSRCDVF